MLKKLFHNYKTIDLYFEQKFGSYSNLYYDYKIVKCKWCGKTKTKITSIYTAEITRIFLDSFSLLSLTNKKTIEDYIKFIEFNK